MTREEAIADYAAHLARNGGTSIFTQDAWVAWRVKPAPYRGKSMGTGHEVYARHHHTHVPLEVERGMDPGLFS